MCQAWTDGCIVLVIKLIKENLQTCILSKQKKFKGNVTIPSHSFSTEQMEQPNRAPKKMSKRGPTKQNIGPFLLCSIMTVAPCLHLNFRTKVGIKYWDDIEDFRH